MYKTKNALPDQAPIPNKWAYLIVVVELSWLSKAREEQSRLLGRIGSSSCVFALTSDKRNYVKPGSARDAGTLHEIAGDLRVAGKTGNLSGRSPQARYEWFTGVAPATHPRIAVAVVQAHGHLWWRSSAQIAADVFSELFCEKRRCSAERVARYTGDLGAAASPLFLNETSDAR